MLQPIRERQVHPFFTLITIHFQPTTSLSALSFVFGNFHFLPPLLDQLDLHKGRCLLRSIRLPKEPLLLPQRNPQTSVLPVLSEVPQRQTPLPRIPMSRMRQILWCWQPCSTVSLLGLTKWTLTQRLNSPISMKTSRRWEPLGEYSPPRWPLCNNAANSTSPAWAGAPINDPG